jgi:YVTN family beta-propeller protein
LTALLHEAFPDLSTTSRAVLCTLGCRNGNGHSADEIAAWVGLPDRHHLYRSLRREGLPQLRQLAAWARVLYWLSEVEATGASLLELAGRDRLDVAVAYRLVRRVTGMRWSQAKRQGLSGVLALFQEHCRHERLQARYEPAPDRPGNGTPHNGRHPGLFRSGSRPAPRMAHDSACRHPGGILAERVPLSGSPFDVAVSPALPGLAWVTRVHAARVDCLETESLRMDGSIVTGSAPTMVAISPDGSLAYVNNQFSADVSVMDLERQAVIETIPIPADPLALVLAPDGRTLYVLTNSDRILRIDCERRRVVESAPVVRAAPLITIHPSGRFVYVPTWREGSVLEVNAQTLLTGRRWRLGGTTQDPVVSADGRMLYVANLDGWLDALDLVSGHVAGRLSLGAAAVSLARSPDDAVLYVGLVYAGRVAIIDRAALRVTGMIETGGKPRRIAFDPDGRWALIANEAGWVDLVR